MAAVQLLTATDRPDGSQAAPPNVVRIVDFLGPISPELALVDPALAPRARALLPEFPGIRVDPSADRPASPRPRAATPSAPRRLGRAVAVGGIVAGLAVVLAASVVGDAVRTSGIATTPSALVAAPPRPPARQPAGPVAPAPSAAKLAAPPRFAWAPEVGTSAYRLALYRGGSLIFERDVRATALQIPGTWTFRGRPYTFTKGSYRWVVWPLAGSGAGATPGPAIVSATYAA